MTELLETGAVILDRYRITKLLGAGGQARVYEAEHLVLGTRVAIKVLRGGSDLVDELRLEREARALAAMKSPFVVKVLDAGKLDSGRPFVVMERLDGQNLAREADARGGKVALEELLRWMVGIACALAEAHALGVIHRDLKPSNVFISPAPRGHIARVIDFGIARHEDTGTLARGEPTAIGTPRYMPLEQLQGEPGLDGRADVFALGVMLYRLLTGTYPYEGSTIAELIEAQRAAPSPIRTHRPDLPEPLADIVMRAIAPRRDDRWPRMRDLADALTQLTGTPPSESAEESPTTLAEQTPARSATVALPKTNPPAPPAPPTPPAPPAPPPSAKPVRPLAVAWKPIVVASLVTGTASALAVVSLGGGRGAHGVPQASPQPASDTHGGNDASDVRSAAPVDDAAPSPAHSASVEAVTSAPSPPPPASPSPSRAAPRVHARVTMRLCGPLGASCEREGQRLESAFAPCATLLPMSRTEGACYVNVEVHLADNRRTSDASALLVPGGPCGVLGAPARACLENAAARHTFSGPLGGSADDPPSRYLIMKVWRED